MIYYEAQQSGEVTVDVSVIRSRPSTSFSTTIIIMICIGALVFVIMAVTVWYRRRKLARETNMVIIRPNLAATPAQQPLIVNNSHSPLVYNAGSQNIGNQPYAPSFPNPNNAGLAPVPTPTPLVVQFPDPSAHLDAAHQPPPDYITTPPVDTSYPPPTYAQPPPPYSQHPQ